MKINTCNHCGVETTNPRYCSRSCSASVNNSGVRRHGAEQVLKHCPLCGNSTKNPSYCSNVCQRQYEAKVSIETNTASAYVIKKYLTETFGYVCNECGIGEWNKKPITLELEHKNGDSSDNSISNTCLLCPNCHSQTDTYKGKNRGKGRHSRRLRYAEGKSY